ncbi:acyl carrier protein [Achromobacter deleyi]|uniref:acyl carrier protein n=1 Tax=Achromobacter deleyi TaxID=1353891 RepID=UPI0014922BB0|nr:acyl carrier protein [Achromobacter deleyi]QVQ28881.1 hypothetical protein HLG70_10975 [Achromobacter deleyi]UIP18997.1 hypothetical protein LYZ39_18560 [Achromobacter deleyi]
MNLANDDHIVASRAVNTLFMMELVVFVERHFGLTIENKDLELCDFSSIDALMCFIETNRA